MILNRSKGIRAEKGQETGALSAPSWVGQGGGQYVEWAGLGRHLGEGLTGGSGWLHSHGVVQWPGAEIKDLPRTGRSGWRG